MMCKRMYGIFYKSDIFLCEKACDTLLFLLCRKSASVCRRHRGRVLCVEKGLGDGSLAMAAQVSECLQAARRVCAVWGKMV